MPVIVVGADSPIGMAVVDAVLEPDREIRAFVSDPGVASQLKKRGVKVALGDLSDGSHVSGACLNVFSAVLVGQAAADGREMSFAKGPAAVLDAWAAAVSEASVQRVIWVLDHAPPPTRIREVAVVSAEGRTMTDVATEVADLDDAASI